MVAHHTTTASGEVPPIESLSFETALRELEAIVDRLEKGSVALEESILLYERGQLLKAHCEDKLKAAELRLEKVVANADTPFLEAVKID